MNQKERLRDVKALLHERELQLGTGLAGTLTALLEYCIELEAKIERLEKAEALYRQADLDVEGWREEVDEEIRDYEDDVTVEQRHEYDPMVAFNLDPHGVSGYSSGRCSSSAPNVQSIPRESTYLAIDGTRRDWRTGDLVKPADSPAAPKQVYSCSRCNTPNEYQDGPFTCHSCRT